MKIKELHKARALRQRGFSLKEIATKLNVAKSSVSIWVRDVQLSIRAERRLLTKIKLGQLIAARNKKEKTRNIEVNYLKLALQEIKNLKIDKKFFKLLCAVMYWCEGTKDAKSGVCFINSNPDVIKKFLILLRGSFRIDEKKFRPCIHLHAYHSTSKQLHKARYILHSLANPRDENI